MAEPFSVVAGAVSIATAFGNCIEIFNYVQLGRHFGRDYQTARLKLTLVQLRLSRWGEAVGVYSNPPLKNLPSLTAEDKSTAKKTFLQILELFEESNRLSKRLGTKDGRPQDSQSHTGSSDDMAVLAARRKMRDLALSRQQRTSSFKVAGWAISDRKKFNDLIDNVSNLVSGLEELFPPPRASETRLAREEAALLDDKQRELLVKLTRGLDDVLGKAISQVTGHVYKNVDIKAREEGRVIQGNLIGDNYSGGFVTDKSHQYDGVRIDGLRLKVLQGNKYGGDDFFSS